MRRRLLAFMVFILMTAGFIMPTAAQTDCPDTLPSRLVIGQQGRVLPGSANNVRDQASRSGAQIGQIPGEGVFNVLEGPVCADGFAWWRVDYEGLVGWTVEAIGQDYAVEPLAPPEPVDLEIEFEGVSFILNSTISTGAVGRIIDPMLKAPIPSPTHIEFELDGVSAYYGAVSVWPAAAFDALNNHQIMPLMEVLETRAEPPVLANTLPIRPGIPTFIAQMKYVDFDGGSGIRKVDSVVHDVSLRNDSLNYFYSGLTADGTHYVQVTIPVSLAALKELEETVDLYPDDSNVDTNAIWEQYITDAEALLNAAQPGDFTPSLDQLDRLVASIKIAPDTLSEVIEEFSVTATAIAETRCGNLDSRLIVDGFGQQALSQDSLRVRAEPGGEATGENVFPGDVVKILDGPICVDEINWWQVSAEDGAWTGWIAEAGDEYFFNPIEATVTPTFTPTITRTATPDTRPTSTPAPTATQIVTGCIVTAIADSNLRTTPDGNTLAAGYMPANVPFYADAQFRRQGEDFGWWRLTSDSKTSVVGGQSGGGRWVRADFVREEGNCASLPVVGG